MKELLFAGNINVLPISLAVIIESVSNTDIPAWMQQVTLCFEPGFSNDTCPALVWRN